MDRRYRYSILFTVLIFMGFAAFAQPGQGRRAGGTVTGTVIDSVADSPVGYANIVLYSDQDSSQVDGTITSESGRFTIENVPPGKYFLEIRFIGFHDRILPDVAIQPGASKVNIGTVYLDRSALNSGEEVVVEGTTPAMEYKIDRKVIDVSQQQTTATGTAVDILENVPSVRVDIEGNVSLRGSESFTVLIDGRPTVLDGNEALQQIPVSSIQNIEIITNPSAKYDPEGTSGIINIVLKKEKFVGSSGMVDLSAGWDDRYSGDALYNYKTDDYTLTLNLDYRKRNFDGTQQEYRRTTNNGTTNFIDANGSSVRGGEGGGFRAAFEYNFSENDQLTLNTRYGSREWRNTSEMYYEEWTSANSQIEHYTNQSRGSRDGTYYDISASYLKQFNQDGHELSAEFSHDKWGGGGLSVNQLLRDGQIQSGRKSVETGPSLEYEFQLEYTFPHWEDNTFEAGYEVESEESEETSEQYIWNTNQDDFVFQPQFSRTMVNSENTQSLFALYSDELNKFGYQLGFRGEYTYRNIARPDSSAYFSLDRWDFFPTLHTSYSIGGAQQIMASYSRRIDRPRSWYLEPFLTWRDAYNVNRGNPSLVPEYIDSYEIGYQTRIGKSVFNFETYARKTHNKIERIQQVYPAEENVVLHTVDNVGTDFSLGTEFNIRYNILEQWNINLMGDFYRYQVWGDYAGESFDRQSFTWSSRLMNTFKFNDVWQIQWDAMYRSPRVSSQERDKASFRSNLSVRRDFLDKKVTTTLQVRDIFSTSRWASETDGPGFYTESVREMDTPIIMLSVKININNYRQERRGTGGPGGGMDEGGEMGGGGEF
ncbi:MAG: TonB-dependent receptor [Candidatus Marinimicrobia bacterium]|nr:TonB-dependent receptor [Candidatus Neomarinimicrobiota bacterium]MCF7827551.1 TonB-dependent receptor [Candidatus Neomarinimicrobiota bacterium]MCF7881587.1 TonB-dependent receptor [Candidatus Neomarinimicrobiota bacterium]